MIVNNPTHILLSIVDSDYPGDINIDDFVDPKNKILFKKTLRLAEKNGLRYYFIKQLIEMGIDLSVLIPQEEVLDELNRSINFKETVTFLNTMSNEYNIEYAIIKIFNTIPHTPNDVDIFVRKEDRLKLMDVFADCGFGCIHSSPAETKFNGTHMKIDIYTEINYVGINFIDSHFVMESSIKNNFMGVDYNGLNKESDLLMLLPHSLFGHRRITLLDFLHMKALINNLNVEECRKYAFENGWGEVFDQMFHLLNSLLEDIYIKNKTIVFPYTFDRKFILQCINQLDNPKFNKFYFNLSYYLEATIYKFENTLLYNSIKNFAPARNLVNTICAHVKKNRGDSKSTN